MKRRHQFYTTIAPTTSKWTYIQVGAFAVLTVAALLAGAALIFLLLLARFLWLTFVAEW